MSNKKTNAQLVVDFQFVNRKLGRLTTKLGATTVGSKEATKIAEQLRKGESESVSLRSEILDRMK